MSAPSNKLRRPAFAKELMVAREMGEAINLTCFVGSGAWDRAKTHNGGARGHRLVVEINRDVSAEDYDFRCLDGLDLILLPLRFDPVLAQQIARRMCSHGARMVLLLHPSLEHGQFFYGAAR